MRVLGGVDDRTALRIALLENLQRRDLDPLKEATGYARLRTELGTKQAQIAEAVGRSQPAVAKSMELPEDVRGESGAGRSRLRTPWRSPSTDSSPG